MMINDIESRIYHDWLREEEQIRDALNFDGVKDFKSALKKLEVMVHAIRTLEKKIEFAN